MSNPLPPLYGPFAGLCFVGLSLWLLKDLWLVTLAVLGIIYLLLRLMPGKR